MSTRERIALLIAVLTLVVFAMPHNGVVDTRASDARQKAKSGAKEIEDLPFTVPINANGFTIEQQNISDRMEVTSDPTRVMWIQMVTLDGKVVSRFVVRGKVTSSGKRLEPLTLAPQGEGFPDAPNENNTSELMQQDGTFGSSDAYIYWFDPAGRYHQWGTAGGLGYLLTDYPIDLSNPQDLTTGMFNADQNAAAWQLQREKEMCQAADANIQASQHCQEVLAQ